MNKMKPKETEEKTNRNEIREAKLEDVFAMAKINYDWWTQSYRGIIEDSFLDTIDLKTKQERMVEFMKNDDWKSVRLVYVADWKIVWFVHGGEKRDNDIDYEAEIYAIYVDPSIQGKGIGKALMNAIGETSHFKDKTSFYLWTLKDKPETRWFYEKLWGKVFTEKEQEIGGKKYSMVGYYRQK